MNKAILKTLTASGTTMTVNEWSAKIGIKPYIIHGRLAKGWTEEEALSPQIGRPHLNRQYAERALNDMTRNQLPSQLEKLIQPNIKTGLFGTYFREYYRDNFNEWYDKVFVPNHAEKKTARK